MHAPPTAAALDADLRTCRRWIGNRETRSATLEPWPAAALAATLDRDDPWPENGTPLPPAGHWVYFHEATPLSRLGPDGHAALGGFLPRVPLPRRMWAGGTLRFLQPLRVGQAARKVSTVQDIQAKRGRSGALIFVTVRHEVYAAEALCLSEDQTLVYRESPPIDGGPCLAATPPGPAAKAAPDTAQWSRVITPGPVLLFRYSALTFNGHRIHYDRSYCAEVEGHPGLLVHAPLMATLMLDLIRRHDPTRPIRAFSYRALAPVFDTAPFTVNGTPTNDGASLWITHADGSLAMRGDLRSDLP